MLQALRFTLLVNKLNGLRKRSATEVLALQQKRLRQILRYAARYSPFYRERFAGINLDTCALTDLPTLTKAEMMARFDDVVTDRQVTRTGIEAFLDDPSNLGKYYRGRYAVCHTSGSQGQPAVVVQTWKDLMRGFAVQFARGNPLPKRITVLLGRLWNPLRLAVVTQQPGFYPSGAAFTYFQNARLPYVRLLRLSIFDPVEETVERLNAFRPQFLSGYTSSLEVLAREEHAGRLRLRQTGCLEQCTNFSEAMLPASRAFVEEAFGVHVSDQYSMAECSALTVGCNVRGGCHLNADHAVLEVVDDDNRPVPAGTAGSKVLLTNLYNRIQPIVRYEIGDVVTLSAEACPCGSNLPRIESVAGRSTEQLWVEENDSWREIPYYLFLGGLDHCLDVAEHQVVQTGRNRFVVRVAPLPGKTLPPERMQQLVHDAVAAEGLANLVEVSVEVVAEIKPDPGSGKRQRVLNLIGPPPAEQRSSSLHEKGVQKENSAVLTRPLRFGEGGPSNSR